MKDIIVIVGPTGIGKTKLSIELAKKLDAEIINGDSVSIYKRLNIGSAKPTKEEQSGIPHHLIDIKDVDEDYTVFDYQKDVRKKIEEIKEELKDLDKEKALDLAKKKSKVIKDKIDDLATLAKEKATPAVNQALEDLRKQGATYLKRSNRIPMAVLGYLTPKEKRVELMCA